MLKDDIESWSKLIIKDANMKVPIASKKLKDSLSSVMVDDYTLEIYGKDYGKYVDAGTGLYSKPTKIFINMEVGHNQDFYKSIWDWIKAKQNSGSWKPKENYPKRSRKKIAYLIMKKIKRDGTPSTEFLSETIVNSFDKLKEIIKNNYNTEIEMFIGREFKKISNL